MLFEGVHHFLCVRQKSVPLALDSLVMIVRLHDETGIVDAEDRTDDTGAVLLSDGGLELFDTGRLIVFYDKNRGGVCGSFRTFLSLKLSVGFFTEHVIKHGSEHILSERLPHALRTTLHHRFKVAFRIAN